MNNLLNYILCCSKNMLYNTPKILHKLPRFYKKKVSALNLKLVGSHLVGTLNLLENFFSGSRIYWKHIF